ncbi:putative 60S ribosomal protein L13 [Monoraphidium neglectum]|uniref:Putative 60S ribosomal protein L13 n=1 Tax=Monoraphidium neglectum TaxID=145388 RepID=A0A0D2NFH5_9CHLO|nr:putative 60S ribosomal protein L13 [Monoraphidium neglectum]KIZ03881.1 putative 60S ribosomal protein L13 [Monoraphidium neglectum]|eukprot:XP_013902900.1 putative 60S ribosomal protein L13 [Monoraphidium neglectum]
MVKHNNVIPNQHFKKKWQFRVRTWFNQPARKLRRRQARAEKAAKAFPRPAAGALRPVVHGQTIKYNAKVRLGRGFTLAELKLLWMSLQLSCEGAAQPFAVASSGLALQWHHPQQQQQRKQRQQQQQQRRQQWRRQRRQQRQRQQQGEQQQQQQQGQQQQQQQRQQGSKLQGIQAASSGSAHATRCGSGWSPAAAPATHHPRSSGALDHPAIGNAHDDSCSRPAPALHELCYTHEAGIPAKLAPTIGISVDHRRRNSSLEGLQANVARLKAYRSNLVIFPRNANKPKKFEASKEEAAAAAAQVKGPVIPVVKEAPALEKVKITQELKDFKAYTKLRIERMNARLVGVRAKRAKEAEAAEKENA